MLRVFLIVVIALIASVIVQARSFSADAVQMRGGQFSYAKMFWYMKNESYGSSVLLK